MGRVFPNDPRIELVLGDLNPGMERLGGITRKNGNAALAENLSRIDSGIDQMDGAAGLGHTCLDGLTPGLQSAEGRQERWMNIQDASGESLQKGFLDDTHESGKDHKINPSLTEQADNFCFCFG